MALVAAVKFTGNNYNDKTYHFKTNIVDLVKGDQVVVDSNNSFQVATFYGYVNNSNVQKWLIQRVDLTEHYARNKVQREADALLYQMKTRVKNYNELDIINKLAHNDPYLNELLQKYQTKTSLLEL